MTRKLSKGYRWMRILIPLTGAVLPVTGATCDPSQMGMPGEYSFLRDDDTDFLAVSGPGGSAFHNGDDDDDYFYDCWDCGYYGYYYKSRGDTPGVSAPEMPER